MSKFKESMPIQVRFRVGIRSDGEITRVRIVQADQEVQLTWAQAASLVSELQKRLPKEAPK